MELLIDLYALKISCRSPAEDADASDDGIFIPPNTEIFINLKAIITTADRAIKSVAKVCALTEYYFHIACKSFNNINLMIAYRISANAFLEMKLKI